MPHGQDGPAWTAGCAERGQSRSWGSWANPSGGRWHLRGLMGLLTAAETFIYLINTCLLSWLKLQEGRTACGLAQLCIWGIWGLVGTE